MERDKSKSVGDWVLTFGAVVCFAATLWLALNDKASAATVTAILTLGLAAFRYLPLIDSIEAFGLKAKLRDTVEQADSLLADLRSATTAASKLTYVQLAYLGRLASPTWAMKRGLLRDTDSALQKIGESDGTVSELRVPLVRFLLADLFYVYTRVQRERTEMRRKAIHNEEAAQFGGRAIQAADPLYRELVDRRRALRDPEHLERNLMIEERFDDFAELLQTQLENSGLPEEDKEKLRPFARRVSRIGQIAWDKKAIIDEAFDILDEVGEDPHSTWAAHYKTVFGEEARQPG